VGHVLDRGEHWEVLSFPAIAERDEDYPVESALGPIRYRRKVGEVLDPSRESWKILQGIRQTIGEYNFSSQYQQSPVPREGAIIRNAWLQYYDPDGYLPDFTVKFQCWDTANKSGEFNDYSVCTTWGFYEERFYLLDVFRRRLNYPELKKKVIELLRKHEPRSVFIEDKASGTQLIQDLTSEGHCGIKAFAPPPGTDKIMRLYAQSAKFESGRVLLPSSAPWLDEYVRELTSFPGTKHDDQVDSTTMALDEEARAKWLSIFDVL